MKLSERLRTEARCLDALDGHYLLAAVTALHEAADALDEADAREAAYRATMQLHCPDVLDALDAFISGKRKAK